MRSWLLRRRSSSWRVASRPSMLRASTRLNCPALGASTPFLCDLPSFMDAPIGRKRQAGHVPCAAGDARHQAPGHRTIEGTMLSTQDNEYLTRIGPGTPMGDLMRQYWIPALRCDELPEPDCPPVRVKLL